MSRSFFFSIVSLMDAKGSFGDGDEFDWLPILDRPYKAEGMPSDLGDGAYLLLGEAHVLANFVGVVGFLIGEIDEIGECFERISDLVHDSRASRPATARSSDILRASRRDGRFGCESGLAYSSISVFGALSASIGAAGSADRHALQRSMRRSTYVANDIGRPEDTERRSLKDWQSLRPAINRVVRMLRLDHLFYGGEEVFRSCEVAGVMQ